MASFTNFATLSYNGGTTNSNIVTGEILEALTAVKTAVSANYSAGDRITYALSLVNTGTAAITDYTVTDNLGGYTVGANTVYPLAYNAGTVRYYINGVLQTAPTVTAGPPLTVTGLTVPAGGSAVLIYETTATPVAPLATGNSITNTATITGAGLTNPITAQATVETAKESERGIVDIETLKYTNQSLISTLDEVLQIQTDGAKKRQEAETELRRIEGELKQKLLEARQIN